ncbi:MAG: hypothetical protein KBB99_02765 [Bacilli bacterium]|jgi:hypothetical protein|nr:hypothetical protein [Bacilli bacterium]HOR17491.1 hypothetical protein [Bacilli bacterium]
MSKKCFEDLIFFQNRLSRNNKKKFRDFVFERAGGLGLRSENYPRFKGQKNILIGDIRKAKYIIATYYDTPVKMPAFITRKAPLSNLLLSAISAILAILLVAIFPKFFYLAIPFVLLAIYSMGWLGGGKRFNFNTSSGIICLLTLMKEVKTMNNTIAYVFLDNHYKGFLGAKAMYHQMVKEDLISLDKKIIFVDRIGQGRHFVFDYFRETKFIDEVKEAIELKVLEQAKFHYREDTKEDKSDYTAFKKLHHVAIRAYPSIKDKKYFFPNSFYQDKNIDLENVDYIVTGIKKFLEKYNVQVEEETPKKTVKNIMNS